ncbi:MAG: MFS transporter [Clostridiaceae bacterium]
MENTTPAPKDIKTKEVKANIFYLFQYKSYRKLLIANSISRFGDSIDAIAFSWLVYMFTGSEMLLGITFAVNSLPNLLLGAFTGLLADRLDKKKLIIYSYLGRGLSVALISMLYYTNTLSLWHIFALTAFNSTLEILMHPAVTALTPELLPEKDFTKASAFSNSLYRTLELIGTGAAGIIIARMSITGALLIDALTFFVGAIVIGTMKLKAKEKEETSEALSFKRGLIEIKEGFSYIKLNKFIMLVIVLFAIINFCLAPLNVLLPIFAERILLGGPETLSILSMSLTLGTILGGVAITAVAHRFKGNSLLIISTLIFGAVYALLVLPEILSIGAVVIASACFFFMGFMIPGMTAPINGYILSKTDKKYLGRVSGIISLIATGVLPLGAAITGAMAQYLQVSLIFLIMGAIIIVTSLYLWLGGRLSTR